MAIIDVVKYDGPPGEFAWKHPDQELGTWTQLIVGESQEAVLFKGGQALDSFQAGRHTLSTANLPVLSHLVNLPFGGKSPFTAEVWYVNKLNVMDIKWGTSTPLQLQDPKYNILVSVRSFGQFGVRIGDARRFLLKLVGGMHRFDRETMMNYFRGLLMANIKESISSYLVHKRISILDIHAYMTEISSHIQQRLVPAFQDSGIELNHFYVESINFPENDPATQRVREALAKKAEMDIIGYSYQQERSFDAVEGAAGNPGGMAGGMMNAGMGIGLGAAFAAPAMEIAGRVMKNIDFGSSSSTAAIRVPCAKCGTMLRQNDRFCNGCGADQSRENEVQQAGVLCYECGHNMVPGAKFCPECGDPHHACPSCNADNPQNATTCVKCGTDFLFSCDSCGHSMKARHKFCPECGSKAG